MKSKTTYSPPLTAEDIGRYLLAFDLPSEYVRDLTLFWAGLKAEQEGGAGGPVSIRRATEALADIRRDLDTDQGIDEPLDVDTFMEHWLPFLMSTRLASYCFGRKYLRVVTFGNELDGSA